MSAARTGASGDVFVVGLSHRTAPVELRERLAVPPEKLPESLRGLVGAAPVGEALLVSTCNRVEVYASAADPRAAAEAARRWLAEQAKPEAIETFLYERHGSEAIQHAFRVASSLDSMVLGEAQILGQVKDAYAAARTTGTLGTVLDRAFTHAFSVAKRVRHETGLAAGTVSVSSIACEVAKKIFGALGGRRVLLVGAGKMSEAAAKHLRKQGATLYVINRSPERAQELAKAYGGEPRKLEELAAELAHADVVITSTASPRFVITAELMHGVIKARRHRMMLLIDISVPRNVDPRAGEMENVFLYDVDDLQKVSEENLSARRKEAAAAEKIVAGEVGEFEKWRRSLDLGPTIVALRARFRETVIRELERTLPKLEATPEQRKSLEVMADAMVNKLLHAPITALKQGGSSTELIDAVRRLFALPEAATPATPERPESEGESSQRS